MPIKSWIGGSDGPMNQGRYISVELDLRSMFPEGYKITGFPNGQEVEICGEALKQEFIKCMNERREVAHKP